MDSDNYDIFKKHADGMWVWVDSVKDLQRAKERLKQLSLVSLGEYLAVSHDTGQVTAKESSRAATP